ncbi:hypothetical protein Tco_1513988, partial [Tanacetum coccineum]
MITTPESSPSRITSSPYLSPQTYQSPQLSPLRDITRQDAEIPQSQFPTQTQVADEAAFTSVDVDTRGAATTDIGLEAGQGSGTMHNTLTRPHDSPLPRVHTLGSDEGILENDMQQTKKVYSSALTKLILRVKKLEKKERKISKIDKDPTISLVQPEQDMEYDFDVSTAEGFTTASINEEENQRIVRDAEIANQLQEEFDRARQEQEAIAEADQAHDIDWSDPAVLRYHALQNRSLSAAEFRKNMCMYLKNQGGYKHSHFKGMSYEDIRLIFE